MTTYLIVVPSVGSRADWIAPASGIVAEKRENGEVLAYFEGNLNGCVNLVEFKDRVHCAAGRMKTKYPTIAFGVFRDSDFDVVGSFTCSDDFKVTAFHISDQVVLDRWLEGA